MRQLRAREDPESGFMDISGMGGGAVSSLKNQQRSSFSSPPRIEASEAETDLTFGSLHDDDSHYINRCMRSGKGGGGGGGCRGQRPLHKWSLESKSGLEIRQQGGDGTA